jgi:outer membrane lipoprotein-sorting protein
MFGSLLLSAQNLDQGANKILDQLSQKWTNSPSLSIDFTLKAEKEQKVLDSYNGRMQIKGKMFNLILKNMSIFCDGVNIWNYQKDVNEISIFDFVENDISMLNPVLLIQNWKTHFQARFIRKETLQNRSLSVIDLLPKKQESFFKIRLYVDESKEDLQRIIIFEKDNITYTYTCNSFITNKVMEDSQFRLDPAKYPQAEINDMR